MSKTAEKNNIKPDTILKTFWRDNDHFADLFNAALFDGEQVLCPADLTEVDTDVSSMVKFNNHAETVQKVLDVVKKTAYGVDFVIWGLENQSKIHYAMPLRHMIGDSFSYLKEYNEIAARNKAEKGFESSDEYGEKEWDGPFCLADMLEIPEKLKPLVSDYKMNLLQLRKSGSLRFHNADVDTVFDVSCSIYEKDFQKINTVYKEKAIPAELGVVIGAITESQRLINHALQSEKKGGQIYMCGALEELVNEGVQRGRQEGRIEGLQEGIQEGIQANIRTCKTFKISKSDTIKNVVKEFALSEDEAKAYVEKYW